MALGAPAYSFQYNNQTPGVGAVTRTISGLNLNTEANDDGITPNDFEVFIRNVFNALGISLGTTYPKLIETRVYDS